MSTNIFMNFASAANRSKLLRMLTERQSPVTITFEKDDGSKRKVSVTLNKQHLPNNLASVEINKARSVFLKAYDVTDCGLKTIRWERIIDIANTTNSAASPTSAIGRRVSVSTPDLDLPTSISRSQRDQLVRDLQSVGFVIGLPVDDAMLQRFAVMREDRVRTELTIEINILKNILSKVKTIIG